MRLVLHAIVIITLFYSCKTRQNSSTKNKTENTVAAKTPKKNEDKERELKAAYFEAIKNKSLGNSDKAIEEFENCLRIDPNHAPSYYEISILQSNEGNFVASLKNAEKAVEQDKANKWYLLQLAKMQKKSLQYENVLKSYEKLVELDPKNLDFLINLSEAYMVNEKPEKAAEVMNKMESIVGKNDELTLQKKILYLQAGQEDKAIAEIQKLIDSDSQNPKYLNMMGQLYEEIGKPEKALEQYKKILEINPNDGMASLSLATYHKTKKELDQVEKYMTICFKDEKISPSLKLSILMDYIKESKKNEEIKSQTIALLNIMQTVHPNNVKSYVAAGDFYVEHDQIEKAREAYLKASTLDNNSYPIWVVLLSLDMQTKQHQHMFDDSKAALELFPTQPTFYLYNGIASYQLKKYEEAITTLTMGKDLTFDNSVLIDFYQYIGESYHALKKYREADKAFEKSLELKPNQPYLLNNYSYYLSVRKENLKRAEEMAEKANDLVKNQASFEDTYGWVLFQQKKYTLAEEWIKKALDHGGNESGTILEHYGDILYYLDKKTEALEYWKKAKEKDGHSDKIDTKIKEQKYVE